MGEWDRWFGMTQTPPVAGEIIVGCGHTPHAPVTGEAPDPANLPTWAESSLPITSGAVTSRWLVSCAACLRAAGGDVRRVTFREHWAMPTSEERIMDRLHALGTDREAIGAYLEGLDGAELVDVARAIGLRSRS